MIMNKISKELKVLNSSKTFNVQKMKVTIGALQKNKYVSSAMLIDFLEVSDAFDHNPAINQPSMVKHKPLAECLELCLQ